MNKTIDNHFSFNPFQFMKSQSFQDCPIVAKSKKKGRPLEQHLIDASQIGDLGKVFQIIKEKISLKNPGYSHYKSKVVTEYIEEDESACQTNDVKTNSLFRVQQLKKQTLSENKKDKQESKDERFAKRNERQQNLIKTLKDFNAHKIQSNIFNYKQAIKQSQQSAELSSQSFQNLLENTEERLQELKNRKRKNQSELFPIWELDLIRQGSCKKNSRHRFRFEEFNDQSSSNQNIKEVETFETLQEKLKFQFNVLDNQKAIKRKAIMEKDEMLKNFSHLNKKNRKQQEIVAQIKDFQIRNKMQDTFYNEILQKYLQLDEKVERNEIRFSKNLRKFSQLKKNINDQFIEYLNTCDQEHMKGNVELHNLIVNMVKTRNQFSQEEFQNSLVQIENQFVNQLNAKQIQIISKLINQFSDETFNLQRFPQLITAINKQLKL